MSLQERSHEVAAQFDFSDEDVRRCCAQFISELGTEFEPFANKDCIDMLSETGLIRKTSTVCQIPTYVTRVANGTEKVRME